MTEYDPTPLEKLRVLLANEKYDGLRLWDSISARIEIGQITLDEALKEALIGSFMLGAIAYREYARKNDFAADRFENRDIAALQRQQMLILMRSTN